MSPAEAIALVKRARKALRAGLLSFTVLDALVWSCRAPGGGDVVVSLSRLQKLTHSARGTVVAALASLQRRGFVTRIRRRVKVGWRSLVVANRYVFLARRTEFTQRPAIQSARAEYANAVVPDAVLDAARRALAARRAVIQERLLARGVVARV